MCLHTLDGIHDPRKGAETAQWCFCCLFWGGSGPPTLQRPGCKYCSSLPPFQYQHHQHHQNEQQHHRSKIWQVQHTAKSMEHARFEATPIKWTFIDIACQRAFCILFAVFSTCKGMKSFLLVHVHLNMYLYTCISHTICNIFWRQYLGLVHKHFPS